MRKLTFAKKTSAEFLRQVEGSQVVLLPTADIATNPYQPRKQFDEVDIVTLADSIRQHGLLQPITVRYADPVEAVSETYVIVAGERRFRAMKRLSYTEIPSLILDISSREAAELAIIENIMRKDLSMFEVAEALKLLLADFGLTQDELAKRLSTSQSNIANKLRLLRFSDKERAILTDYALTERHARALIRIEDEYMRLRSILHVGEHRLSVKDTEEYVESLLVPRERRTPSRARYSRQEVLDFLRMNVKKPLSKLEKRGILVCTKEYEDELGLHIEILVPSDETEMVSV